MRDAGEAMPLLRRRLARCLVLAGGAIAAWLLASGVASAAEADTGDAPAATVAIPAFTVPASSLPGGSVLDGLDGSALTADAPLAGALAGVAAVLADQHATDWSALGELPAPFGWSAPLEFPAGIELPGAIALPGLPNLGALPTVRLPAHPRPITPPSGDRHQPGLVAAHPAVAADAAPVPAVRTSTPTGLAGAGSGPASAATPDRGSTPFAPIQERPCLPSPALPAPTAGAGGVSAVETAQDAGPITGWLYIRAPRRGPTAVSSIAEQPGTTPD